MTRTDRKRTPRSLQSAATDEVSMSTRSAAYRRRISAFSAAVAMIRSTVRSRPVAIRGWPRPRILAHAGERVDQEPDLDRERRDDPHVHRDGRGRRRTHPAAGAGGIVLARGPAAIVHTNATGREPVRSD